MQTYEADFEYQLESNKEACRRHVMPKNNNAATNQLLISDEKNPLYAALTNVSQNCNKCDLCQRECEFLRRYGKPKEIADTFDPNTTLNQNMPFECNLCRLCTAVCPQGVSPAKMFLEMRREINKNGNGNLPEHANILAYERRGTSRRFTWYNLPKSCDTIFFPGCTLPGTRPKLTLKFFYYLKHKLPSLGIVLDCCTKPSHDLGRETYFRAMFDEMKNYLTDNGIRKVLVACPSCYQMFKQYGENLSVQTVYENLIENGFASNENLNTHETITIHDPCALRFETPVHSAVRTLAENQGLHVIEMPHSMEKTLCCGGGSLASVSPKLSEHWAESRKQEADENRVITYCAGCLSLLSRKMPTNHILELLFERDDTVNGNSKAVKAPITYLNRIKLKQHLKKNLRNSVSRERTFKVKEKNTRTTKIILFLCLIAIVILVRLTGITQYLEQEDLRQLVQSYGVLAPIIFMLIYSIAPAFFLPGLPVTIAGGILFGAVWGVVYSITGATIGACIAFVISRYIARGWIESLLKNPKWKRLDQGVEKQGWKVVAFTRLIPLFPFNLLNYAFGLTKIKFIHYAATTFICMLPGCIAYVVFSSSLLEVLRGRVSTTFVIGLVLVVMVSLIPFAYKYYKRKKDFSDPL